MPDYRYQFRLPDGQEFQGGPGKTPAAIKKVHPEAVITNRVEIGEGREVVATTPYTAPQGKAAKADADAPDDADTPDAPDDADTPAGEGVVEPGTDVTVVGEPRATGRGGRSDKQG